MGINMSQLKYYTVIGAIFVLITGTLSHFLYEWTNYNFVIGLFTPVNESTWEHMKLIFFPMLLYSLFIMMKLKKDHICTASSLSSGILLGTLLIPVIFYTYTGILGYNIFILDLLTFAVSVLAAFYTVYKLALSYSMQRYTILLCGLIIVMTICFLLFTYYPPNIGLFAVP